eukprot:jgi/Bigna1/132593/aug1.18_g7301
MRTEWLNTTSIPTFMRVFLRLSGATHCSVCGTALPAPQQNERGGGGGGGDGNDGGEGGTVQCPVCEGSFPASAIELHVAMCLDQGQPQRPSVPQGVPDFLRRPSLNRTRSDEVYVDMTNKDFLTHIRDGGDFDKIMGDSKEGALIRASRFGKKDIVEELVKRNADVNQINVAGSSPLIAASMRGNLEICKYLVEKKANVLQRTKQADSALSLAVWKKHEEVAILLIEAKADIKNVDSFGDTVLNDAAKNGMLNLARKLVELKLNVNHRNNEGFTPIHMAAREGEALVIPFLQKSGGKVDARDKGGRTPLMWATAVNKVAVVSTPSEEDPEIHCVRALLDCKANPILTDVQGETAMSAVRSKPVADLLTKAMKSNEFSELGYTDDTRKATSL